MRRLGQKHQKILECLKNSKEPLPPFEIARVTRIKHSTVRVYVRDLLRCGKLYQPFFGYYAIPPTYGVGFGMSPLLVHNLCLVDDGCRELCGRGKKEDVEFDVGSVKFHYEFGSKRGKFSCRLSCDEGLDYNGFSLAVNRIFNDFRGFFGREPVFICSLHINRDLFGVELAGFKCFSEHGLLEVVKRIYQKGENSVRVEVGLKKVGLDEVFSYVKDEFNYYKHVKSIENKLDRIEETSKRHSRMIFDYGRHLEKLSSAFVNLFPENPHQKPGLDSDERNPLVS